VASTVEGHCSVVLAHFDGGPALDPINRGSGVFQLAITGNNRISG